ncbi:MAG: metal-dependent hydrolase [Rugosibacter sp.]|nr:metal-dependent hydrolase [Rugosibacter sp.]
MTQGVLGAFVAQAHGSKQTLAKAAAIGALAGMAPDLDVLIRSSTDPLLMLDYHRQFTHSLFFIPFGGLLCSWLLYPLLGKRWQLSYRQVLIWCLLGFATHGVLDWCTSYGTKLLWPFSNERYALDIISIIDPLFTLPLLALTFLAARTRQRAYVAFAWAWGALYLTLGFVQHERAEAMALDLAQSRHHAVARLEVKPSFGNLAVWKSMYTSEGKLYVDAVKPGLVTSRVWPGQSIALLEVKRDFPWLDPASQQAQDIARFNAASIGFLAPDPANPLHVGDMRYSLLPHHIDPLWGIRLSANAPTDAHVGFYTHRGNAGAALSTLIDMMFE